MICRLPIFVKGEINHGRGEDAAVHNLGNDSDFFFAVMDGCGGAGGKQYAKASDWTGAKLSATHVGQILFDWFTCPANRELPLLQARDSIKNAIVGELSSVEKYVSGGDTMILSSLSRILPTTLVMVTGHQTDKETIVLRYYWVGDTRGYILYSDGSDAGLRQITRDDIRDDLDPYEDLTKDGLLKNMINLSKDFPIHSIERTVSRRCLVFAATDGCFSYFRSPIELEWTLLDTLENSAAPQEWEESLSNRLGALSQDDYTLSLVALKFADFKDIKSAFRARWKALRGVVETIDHATTPEDYFAVWEKYRPLFLSEQAAKEE